MKVFFTSSQTSKSSQGDLHNKILEYLQKNYQVKTRIYVNFEGADEEVEQRFIDTYEQTKKNLLSADIVIAEASYPTASLGHEIALALDNNKPTIVMINDTVDKNKIPSSIRGNKSKQLLIKYYSPENMFNNLDDLLKQAKSNLDSKFILIIPPEIERYLSWASHKKGIRKAEVVRAAIERYMEHDADYKKYLADIEE